MRARFARVYAHPLDRTPVPIAITIKACRRKVPTFFREFSTVCPTASVFFIPKLTHQVDKSN